MRLNLLIVTSLTCLLAACADHSGSTFGAGNPGGTPENGADPTAGGDRGPGSQVSKIVEGQDGGSGLMPGEDLPQADGTDGDIGGTDGSQPVPEPGTLLLVGTGLAGVALLRRRRRHGAANAE